MSELAYTALREGVLLVNKPQGRTSFSLVRALRKLVGIKKVGHAGTLDPFATGVMVMLLGRDYTRLSDKLLLQDKEYLATMYLGVTTDTYDCDGKVVASSKKKPSSSDLAKALAHFQGEIEQVPPMFSARKVKGKKLYELARQGIVIERRSAKVRVTTELMSYAYPYVQLRIACSKGTYIRSIAHEMGEFLGCGAHLSQLKRTKSGLFTIEQCMEGELLDQENFDITPHLLSYECLPIH